MVPTIVEFYIRVSKGAQGVIVLVVVCCCSSSSSSPSLSSSSSCYSCCYSAVLLYRTKTGRVDSKPHLASAAAPVPVPVPVSKTRQVSSYAGPATEFVGSNALTASFVASSAAVKCMASFKVRSAYKKIVCVEYSKQSLGHVSV